MNAPATDFSSPRRQLGAASVAIAMLIMFILGAAVLAGMSISGSSVIDAAKNDEQISALFLAESGLERAQGKLASSWLTNTDCTGIAGGSYALGRGTFSLTASSVPPTCDSTTCTSCTIQSTGAIGNSNRQIARTITRTQGSGGTYCKPPSDCTNTVPPVPTWKSTLKNDSGYDAIALFNLAANRLGNWTGVTCNVPPPYGPCVIKWTIDAQNGTHSVSSMGNAVTIPNGASYTIYQTLNINKDVVENGALFPGSGSVPSIVGAYWDDTNVGGGPFTIGKTNDSDGQTNNGTLTSSGTCSAPASNSKQTCTNWCYGADTLVFGFAAHSTNLNDGLTSVNFNTAGTPIALQRVGNKFPASTDTGAPADVYSEIWYAHNPDYLSNATATSGGVVTGSIGATFTGALTDGSNVMGVTVPSGVLHTGDTVTCNGGVGCPAVLSSGTTTITGQTSGPTGGEGNYTLSANCVDPNCDSRSDKTSSNKLEVTAVASGYLSVGDTITGTGVTTTTITAIAGAGNVTGSYGISTAQTVSSTAITANGATIHVTGGTGVPTAGTIVAVRAGTGAFYANTTVLSAPDPTATLFKVSAVPRIPLSAATICGGTCAFFDQTPGNNTTFSITKSAGTYYWAAGFMCLNGVDQTLITPTAASTTVKGTTWSEVVK